MNKWLANLDQTLSKAKLRQFDWWLILVILLTLSLGQLQRVTMSPTVAFYLHDLLILGWLFVHQSQFFSFFRHFQLRSIIKKWWLEVLFVGWVVMGMLLAPPDLAPWLYLIRLTVYILFLISLRLTFQKKPMALRMLVTTLGLLYVWFGLIQYAFLPDTRFLFNLGWDDHYYRLMSTLLDPNFAGMIFVLTFAYIYSLKTLLCEAIKYE